MFYKLGLVLSGGGGKGSYEIGVLKALEEFGITRNIQGIAGTSVGALNAAAFLHNDLKRAEEMWLSIGADQILSLESGSIISRFREMGIKGNLNRRMIKQWVDSLVKNGIYSRSGLIKIIQDNLDLKKIAAAHIPCLIATTKVPEMKVKYFPLNGLDEEKIISILLASSALPGIFSPEEVAGSKYLDGGLIDNAPVQPLYDLGCDLIIVVHLKRDKFIDCSKYPDARIIEIVPSKDQGGLISGTLNFQPEIAAKRIKQGYNDTKELFKPIYELTNSFYDFVQHMEELRHNELSFKEVTREAVQKKINLKDELSSFFKMEGRHKDD